MKPKHLLALGVLLVGVTSAASLAAQKPAPPPPTEQQKLKERVDTLESQLKDAQAKADRAAFEKDRIESIQKEAKDYYDKVLSTQTWTLGIVGLIITIVSAATARFGLTIFDRHIEAAISKANTQFDEKLKDATRALKHSSSTHFKELESANIARMKQLEDDLNKRIEKKVAKVETETTASLFFSLAVSFALTEKYAEARGADRYALETIAKNPEGFTPTSTQLVVNHLFRMIKAADPQKFHQEAKKELAADFYGKFENALNATALEIPELAQVLNERRAAPPSTPKS